MLCTNIVLNVKTKTKKTNFCTQYVVNLYFSENSMNNLLSYCGLTDARMRASEKDLPVLQITHSEAEIPKELEQPKIFL